MIREAASTSRKKLKEISLVGPRRSASKPLGSEKKREKMRGIETIMLATRMDNSYSLIRIGRRAMGRFV
jgi:hypothetical protein